MLNRNLPVDPGDSRLRPKGDSLGAEKRDNAAACLDPLAEVVAESAAEDRRKQHRGGVPVKKFLGALVAAALATPLAIGTALANEAAASDAKIACSEVKYSAEFLKKYPDAPAACIEAVEKEGKRYAKFQARVYLNSADRTTVELLNTRGDRLSTFSFKPGPDAAVDIDGKKTKFTDLKKGEKISFYVSEDRLTASELPGSTEESWAVLPPQ